ncbi:MAG: LD-carboxypeptidase [Nitrososphaerota archaeon]|nr:LD-carboxypeptidase [Nitrososphaerota archaeon]
MPRSPRNQELQKPPHLDRGDTIAVVSQSWGGPAMFPHIYDRGIANLKETFGLRVKEYPTTREKPAYLHEHPEKRADDINRALADPEVKGIFSSIGGEDSVRVLPFIDAEAALSNPKILLGYSDAHTVVSYLNSQGLVTYAGPSVMAGFSQMEEFPDSFARHIEDILFSGVGEHEYRPYPEYSERYPDWSKVESTGKTNPKKRNPGWKWLQVGGAKARGRLFGGCMDVLEFLKGTRFWPQEPGFWDGKILFFESSEEKPSPDMVRYWLRNYGMQGVLGRISGLLFGRPVLYSDDEKLNLEKSIVSVVKGEFGRGDIPVVLDMDFGHTDPQFIMPLGIQAEIDSDSKQLRITEPTAG